MTGRALFLVLLAVCVAARLVACPLLVALACAWTDVPPLAGAQAAAFFGACFLHRDLVLLSSRVGAAATVRTRS